jgi:hypothetical protein
MEEGTHMGKKANISWRNKLFSSEYPPLPVFEEGDIFLSFLTCLSIGCTIHNVRRLLLQMPAKLEI